MLAAIHVHPPHFRPVHGAKLVAACQIENCMHTTTGGGQTRGVQQIADNRLHLGTKNPAGLIRVAAKNSQAGIRFKQGANAMSANKTSCTRYERYSCVCIFFAGHGDLFTN